VETFFSIVFIICIILSIVESNKKKSNRNNNNCSRKERVDDINKTIEIGKEYNFDNEKKYDYENSKQDNGYYTKVLDRRYKKNYIEDEFLKFKVSCIYHITHRNNINRILEKGILSHSESHRLGLNSIDISDPGAQRWRERSDNPHGKKIHEFAPFYINPKNPMLYVRRNLQNELCILEISLLALEGNQYLITDGNAASRDTQFFDSVESLNGLPWDVLCAKYWNDFSDGRRKRCAEVLIYPKVSPNMIHRIHCCSQETLNSISGKGVNVQLTKKYFF